MVLYCDANTSDPFTAESHGSFKDWRSDSSRCKVPQRPRKRRTHHAKIRRTSDEPLVNSHIFPMENHLFLEEQLTISMAIFHSYIQLRHKKCICLSRLGRCAELVAGWLVVTGTWLIFSHILGSSSSQLTSPHIFQRGRLNHQPAGVGQIAGVSASQGQMRLKVWVRMTWKLGWMFAGWSPELAESRCLYIYIYIRYYIYIYMIIIYI